MAQHFFGQWLLGKGLISSDTLLAAIAFQKNSNLPIGELAVKAGYLNPNQVTAINHEQQRTDSLFGEIAVARKLLDPDQLDDLLAVQKRRRVFLGEALVSLRGINREVVDKELRLFEMQQHEEDLSLQKKIDELLHSRIVRIFIDTTTTMLQRMIREPIKLSDVHPGAQHDNNLRYCISQKMTGENTLSINLVLPERLILLIASKMLCVEQTQLHDLALHTAADFVSLIAHHASEKQVSPKRWTNIDQPQLIDLERLGGPVPSHVCLAMSSIRGDFQINFLFH